MRWRRNTPISWCRTLPDEANTIRGTGRFDERGTHHLPRDLHGRCVTEAHPDVGDVVVDRLGYTYDGRISISRPHRLTERAGAALRAVAANTKQDVDTGILDEVRHDRNILTAARAPENRSPQVMDGLDLRAVQLQKRTPLAGVQPSKAISYTDNAADAVVLSKLQHDGTNHVVEAGRKTSAGDYRRRRARRLEEDAGARTGLLQQCVVQVRCVRSDFVFESNPLSIRDEAMPGIAAVGRRVSTLAKRTDFEVRYFVHRLYWATARREHERVCQCSSGGGVGWTGGSMTGGSGGVVGGGTGGAGSVGGSSSGRISGSTGTAGFRSGGVLGGWVAVSFMGL